MVNPGTLEAEILKMPFGGIDCHLKPDNTQQWHLNHKQNKNSFFRYSCPLPDGKYLVFLPFVLIGLSLFGQSLDSSRMLALISDNEKLSYLVN